MKYRPHDYQTHATKYILDHDQAAIFLGMGLGKTAITLTALQQLHARFDISRALIIAPLRVATTTWPQEIEKWDHTRGLRVNVATGAATARREALDTPADIYVINRENVPWLVTHYGKYWKWDTVVIDELSSFKNHQSKRFRALRVVRPKIRRIIGLTGTPAPNSLLDLWAPFRLLDEGDRLGRRISEYRDAYFKPDKRRGHQVFTWKIKPGAEQKIYEAIGDMTLSMRTCDYLSLPDKAHQTVQVQLPAAAVTAYKTLAAEYVAELDDGVIDAANAAVVAGKLQQVCSGAVYGDDGAEVLDIHDAKIKALQETVEAAAGETVLVAYWFKHERDRILKALPGARVLDTAEDFQDWNARRIPVGLIHPASAGHGLNLQAGGHILVWVTPPWSLELYEQTNARLYRQGQQEPVSIVHLVAADTIDTRVIAALEGKAVTQDALVRAVSAELGRAAKQERKEK